MKKAVKVIALMCVAVLALMMVAGCGKDTKSDMQYVKDNGKLVVGVTDFAPMDYQEGDEWIGFDADLAKEFAKSLGVDIEIVEIDWDNKIMELDNKSIDCVWNGMTLTDEVKSAMACSKAYAKNAQVVVLPKDKAAAYAKPEDMKDVQFAVEAGSAGKEVADENSFKVVEVQTQADALKEVAAGTSDAAIIDLMMAGAMIGEGTGYAGLATGLELNSEEYGVGFRKGSDLADALNDFFKKAYDDGSMKKIGETYEVAQNIIAQ